MWSLRTWKEIGSERCGGGGITLLKAEEGAAELSTGTLPQCAWLGSRSVGMAGEERTGTGNQGVPACESSLAAAEGAWDQTLTGMEQQSSAQDLPLECVWLAGG
eukprot:1000636-Pelagomonas_calceolata.AAC.1